MRSNGKVIVFGIAFWYPLAGVTYQFLHYLLPLRRLGYDVYYVEDSGRWAYDPTINDMTPDADRNVAAIAPVLNGHGFEGRWAFRGAYEGGKSYGMSESQLAQLYREADAFLNVTGAQELRDEHLAIPRRIYVESDPVASQIRVAKGDAKATAMLDAHDAHFTFGENLGAPDCAVPVKRYRWQPTRQPVDLELWDSDIPTKPLNGSPSYNTIATWGNRGNDIEWNGQTLHWSKHREFEKYIDLPRRRNAVPFEVAAGVGPEIQSLLRNNGWQQVDSIGVSRDVDRYHKYITHSRGEFTVTKEQYFKLRSGWFSDRSACYLAASRPVITADTGFSKFFPTGAGLFGFNNMDDVLSAIDAIESDYAGNCRVARAIAEEFFDADKVVGQLMSRAGL